MNQHINCTFCDQNSDDHWRAICRAQAARKRLARVVARIEDATVIDGIAEEAEQWVAENVETDR